MNAKESLSELMIAAAPERAAETRELWKKYDPDVVVVQDKKRITMRVMTPQNGKQRIEFDAKTMDVFWLIGFSGWRAIECYLPSVVLSGTCRQPVASVLANDPGLSEIERAYKERRATAQTLINAADVETALWPPDIPRPNVDRNAFNDAQYKVAFDLTLLAVAFLAFHEFRHVIFGYEKDLPADQREEELTCDVWAREYMTAKLAAYAQSNGHNYHEVLRKRLMAFALAALVISEITPFWEHGGNTKYFSVAARIQAIVDNTPLPETDHFWIFVASLLVGIYRQRTMPISAPPLLARQLAQHLLNGL